MSQSPLPDSLEHFLQEPPTVRPPAGLQDFLLERTSVSLRKPRVWRRWPMVAGAAAAAIALALVSAYYGVRLSLMETPPEPMHVERKLEPEPPQPFAAAPPAHPLELEWSAFDAEDEQQRARLYFQAGDLYLDGHQDYEAALRCYHQALNFCDARELEYNPDDNWLVMALKRDKRKDQ